MARLDRVDGILLLDKPLGLTSHDAVGKVRRIINQKEVGHTGTLDPLATGLLVLCLGKATKVTQFLSESEKSYEAVVRLGIRSTTFDAEGVPEDPQLPPPAPLAEATVRDVLKSFLGAQDQVVPPHASVRLNGRHMYDLTRQGEEFERPSRPIVINALEMSSYDWPDVRLAVSCSKGTYIRSLANDIGEKLGCGGYLAELRRTAVGRFSLADAVTPEQLEFLVQSGHLGGRILPIEQALEFSSLSLADSGSETVAHGRSPRWNDVLSVDGAFRTGDRILLKNAGGKALAVAIAGSDSQVAHPPTDKPIESFVRVLA